MSSRPIADQGSIPELPAYLTVLEALAWAQFGDPNIVQNVSIRGRQSLEAARTFKSGASRPKEKWDVLGDLRAAKLHAHRRWPGRILRIETKEWFAVDDVLSIPGEGGQVVFKKEDLVRRYPPLTALDEKDERVARRFKAKISRDDLVREVRAYLGEPGSERYEDGREKIRRAIRQKTGLEPGRNMLAKVVEDYRGARGPGPRPRNSPGE